MAIVQTVTGPVDAAEMGTVLSHEHVALFTLGPLDNYRIAAVVKLCEQGFTGRMMLSHDAHGRSDRDIDLPHDPLRANWYFCQLHDNIIPALRQAGLSDERLRMLTAGNAARFFGAAG